MKNKLLRSLIVCVCTILILSAGVYFGLVFYYENVFMMNTWVNDVYCTGKTVEEVNRELLQKAEVPFLYITDRTGNVYEISPEEMGMKLDYEEYLQSLLENQNPFQWPVYVQNRLSADSLPAVSVETDKSVLPECSFDLELIKNNIDKLPFVSRERKVPKERKIVWTSEGYVYRDTLIERLDEDALYTCLEQKLSDSDFLRKGLESGHLEINLQSEEVYKDVKANKEQDEILKKWQTLKSYIDCSIIYDMGDERISLGGKIASGFIERDWTGNAVFDSEGQPKINESAIEDFVNSLADTYNTYKKELTFQSTAGDSKTIPYLNYGTELDTRAEIAYLKEAFIQKRSEVHIPSYKRQGYVRGKNDIGDTYIEIDMGNQKLYAYAEGEILIETDIVTGNVKRKMATPEGVVYVYKKQRNRTLRGPGYASFVKYWMPVKGGIGLHDASWRKKFGGDIYKTDGSHGCINIPRDVMSEIYENFEVGTPVLMFY